jgi:hypothetical protein
MNTPILSISGYVKSGKDTLGALLAARGGFAHYHNAWWAKEATARAMEGHIPAHLIEAYVSTDHALKEVPLPFPPFDGRSSRRFQIDTIEATPMEERFTLNLIHRFIPLMDRPQAVTGMRLTTALSYWKDRGRALGLPLKFVWVVNPEQPPLTGYDAEPGMYPAADSGFWDAVVVNERGQPEGMVPQLRAQLAEVDEALGR